MRIVERVKMSRPYMAPVALLLATTGCVDGEIVDHTIVDGMIVDNPPVKPVQKSITDFISQLTMCTDPTAMGKHGEVGSVIQPFLVKRDKVSITFSSEACTMTSAGMAWVSMSCKLDKQFFTSQAGFNSGFPYQVHISEAITFDSAQETGRMSETVGVVSMTVGSTAELRHSVTRKSLLSGTGMPELEPIDSIYVWQPMKEELANDVQLDFQLRRACYGSSNKMQWTITALDFTTIPSR